MKRQTTIKLICATLLCTSCANYSPAFPGSTHWKTENNNGMFITIDGASPSAKLKKTCPNGFLKLPDKFINDNNHWFVHQRYQCIEPAN